MVAYKAFDDLKSCFATECRMQNAGSLRARSKVCGALVCVRTYVTSRTLTNSGCARFLSNVHGASNLNGVAL